ncbi:A/G-specific adenine glycosylase [Oscillospiraceae bacterium CM]|nr:A/G-specific adenine glycosylase [Oscillospiraceae bacterium CM]
MLNIDSSLTPLLLAWYDENARALPWRADRDPYRVWVSEMMLQQTGVAVVNLYYPRFLEAFPTVAALADADEDTVLKLWEGLGYYSRARNMHQAAKRLVSECGGVFPDTTEDLLKLPGIGTYTAGAIASICFNKPEPAVDGNVVRVISRLDALSDPDPAALKKRIAQGLRPYYDTKRCGDLTQALMELGALICVPNGTPTCSLCPVGALCKAYRDKTVHLFPKRAQKPAKKTMNLTVFVLTCDGQTALRRRDDGGLLGGLWELPNVPEALGDSAAVEQAASWGVKPSSLLRSVRKSHVFTHIRWDMTAYYIDCREKNALFTWAQDSDMASFYPLPTAFKKFLMQP